MASKPTTVAKTVSLSLGLATVFGSLRTVRSTEKAASYRTLCPDCLPAGVPVHQMYTCENDHGPFAPSECTDKGKQVGDVLVPLTAEELTAVAGEASEDGASMSLRIHPADQVPHLARTTGIVYAFDPGPGKAELVGVLLDIMADGEVAFFGELMVKNVRRLFRLAAAPHGIELVEIARPEDVYALEAREYRYAGASLNMAMQLVTALMTDYDPELYRSGAAERLAAVIATKTDGDAASVTTLPSAVPAAVDLEAMLAASLAAAQAGKAA